MSHFLRARAAHGPLGLITVGVVITGLLAATPAADAVRQGSPTVARPTTTATSSTARFTDGHYIVLLKAPSATRYAGGNSDLAATRSTGMVVQRQLAAGRGVLRSPARRQRTVAGDVGAKPDQSYTIATNGFVADLTKQQAIELSSDSRVLLVEKSRNVKLDTVAHPRRSSA